MDPRCSSNTVGWASTSSWMPRMASLRTWALWCLRCASSSFRVRLRFVFRASAFVRDWMSIAVALEGPILPLPTLSLTLAKSAFFFCFFLDWTMVD
ncbi:hypothetical protein BCR44DRAFT_1436699 [Catenaria anguillulae PL171]|uniref:Uncharacterized protein n=1 Tax=Catenaria anguillulae PL171 TaxID=765915 RepID=A0A1Y2HM39_9FUNG|nr:hypothetical protein BCR44DRAFT_1436699 [Catenaria anguillulae PL171]